MPATYLGVLGVAIAFPGVTNAHVFPIQEEPGAGATVRSPTQVSIRFAGPLEPAFSSVLVTNAAGKQVNAASASVDPRHPANIFVRLPELTAGRYRVHWVAVSDDAHRTHGDYTFNVM
ncbi:copper resistance protein CopC [Burkholderia sp. SCN-KJ]|nr:copper resistance protein CopC [Burkholderia sp. SCN-KJ]